MYLVAFIIQMLVPGMTGTAAVKSSSISQSTGIYDEVALVLIVLASG